MYELETRSGGAAFTVVILFGLWLILRRSPNTVTAVLGPPSPSWVYGNLEQLVLAENYGDHEFQWQKQYGPVYRIKGCFGENRLVISDPQALRHLLNDPSVMRPPSQSKTTRLVFGEDSVFCVEGEQHRNLRAALSGGLSGRGVRSFLPVFTDVANKIVHEWEMLCSTGSSTRINVGKMMHLATLEIICAAGFGFHVDTVRNPEHPLAVSHLHVLATAFVRSKFGLLADLFIPHIPEFMLRLGLRLPLGPLSAILNFKNATNQIMKEKARDFERGRKDHYDLLDISRDSASKAGVTPSQVVHQIPVLLLAGQDTTDATLSWAFYWLAQNPEFQEELRREILSGNLGGGSDHDQMPLLNALLKETLRLYPAGPLLERWASEDFVLPLSDEIVTSTGEYLRELPICKGQFIFLAVGAYQRLEAIWGSDADEFRPSRWLAGDPCTGQALGPYAQLLAFLGGPRVCAGWRFAILEMQVMLTELVSKFSFSLPEDSDVKAHLSAIQFPVDRGEAKGLWLTVEPVS